MWSMRRNTASRRRYRCSGGLTQMCTRFSATIAPSRASRAGLSGRNLSATWRAKGSRLLDDRSRESIEMKMNRRFLRYAHPTSTMRIVHFLCTRPTFSHVHNLLKCGSRAS